MKWQPIDTAPRDEDLLLHVVTPHGEYIDIGEYFEGKWMGHIEPGKIIFPSHWMPLPDPPK